MTLPAALALDAVSAGYAGSRDVLHQVWDVSALAEPEEREVRGEVDRGRLREVVAGADGVVQAEALAGDAPLVVGGAAGERPQGGLDRLRRR